MSDWRFTNPKEVPKINLLEIPGSQWKWLCDVQLKPFQKKIIESAKRVERMNRKARGGSCGK